jgi:signal transduction histidine kinase
MFRGRTIATTLTAVNTLVCAIVLLLAFVAFAAYDQSTFRATIVRQLSTQAQIVGSNSVSALIFNDSDTAEETLGALRAASSIMAAEIYTPDGELFAFYNRDGGSAGKPLTIPDSGEETYRFDQDQLTLARRVVFQGKLAGTVSIRSDLSELRARRRQYLGIGASVLTASLFAACLLAWISQRAISRPIVELADTARRVSSERDYSLRAAMPATAREIATLTDAFNDMLAQIQQRDRALHEAHDGLEQRVRRRTAELAAVNSELEAFSYSVSHDLRAPLRHVLGFANLLEEHARAQLDQQGTRYLQTITQAAQKMGRLIDDLLAFSRMGRSQLVSSRVDLADLVREAREEVTATGSPAQPRVEWRIADLPAVEGDRAMLRQVIVNLLSNALKYSSARPTPIIEVGTRRDAGEVVVFVRDNGVGFDMQYAHKLFGVFQRLHRSEEFEGTGIGLANVKRIVHRHGGRVWAEAELERGATFYVSLPDTGPTS